MSDYSTSAEAVKTALDSVYCKKADIVDNLTSTSTSAPLSAKQGKVLNDLIGSAIAYINQ